MFFVFQISSVRESYHIISHTQIYNKMIRPPVILTTPNVEVTENVTFVLKTELVIIYLERKNQVLTPTNFFEGVKMAANIILFI